MTDQETASADATVATETPEQIAERLAAEAAAAAKAAHEAAIAELEPLHDAALAKLDELRSSLQASFAKATAEPDHLAYAQSFVRDVALKAAEIVGWIQRHV